MKKQYTRVFAALFATVAIFSSCSDEIEYTPDLPDPSAVRAVIANEGQFGAGTASLTVLTFGGEVKQDAFRAVNNRPMGDVAQSITEINGRYYVPLNNSLKVEVMDAKTFESYGDIILADRAIPTYVAHLGGDSLAITDKGAGKLWIADIRNDNDAHIPVRRSFSVGSSNQMKLIANKLFLAGSKLRVFTLGQIEESKMREVKDASGASISVVGDSKIIGDKNGNIWVLNSKKLVCIDPVQEKVVKEIVFNGITIDGWGGRLDILPGGENLVINARKKDSEGVNQHGAMIVHIDATEMPKTLKFVFPKTLNQLYNMAVSQEGTIFVCDVMFGSLAAGLIHELTTDGATVATYTGGIFPQYIHFTKR